MIGTGECLYEAGQAGTAATAAPILVGGCQSVALLAGLLAGLALFRKTPAVAAAVMIGLVAADGVLFTRSFIGPWAAFRSEGGAWPAGAAERLRFAGGAHRAWALGLRDMNDGMIERVPTIEGIEPNPPVRFHMMFRMGQRQPVDIAPSVYELVAYEPLPRRMALGYLLVPADATPPGSRMRVLAAGKGWNVLELPSPAPRALVVYRSEVVRAEKEVIATALTRDPKEVVVLEEGPVTSSPSSEVQGGAAQAKWPSSGARIIEDAPNLVRVSADLEKSGWLVLLDNYFPGWTAEANGARARILRANGSFRALALPPGHHEVIFRYRPRSVYWGFCVSMTALAVCAGLFLAASRRKTAVEPTAKHAVHQL
jgi:hypothetical protein